MANCRKIGFAAQGFESLVLLNENTAQQSAPKHHRDNNAPRQRTPGRSQPDPRKSIETTLAPHGSAGVVVGVTAFSSRFRGLMLVPEKRCYPISPTSPHQGADAIPRRTAASGVRGITQAVGQAFCGNQIGDERLSARQ